MEKVLGSVCDSVQSLRPPSVTPAASRHIRKVLARCGGGMVFRLSVKQSGCSGLSYAVDYVAEDGVSNDLRFSIDGDLVVFVDPKSFSYLQGVCVDYVQNGLNGSLKFLNPNQTAACGCGESFTVGKELGA